jgi:hypothetical protein
MPERKIESLPLTRGELLDRVGPVPRRIYTAVRGVLDRLELAAPWEALYSPVELAELREMLQELIVVIDELPQSIDRLARDLESENADRELIEDLEFFFQGIIMSVGSELEQLRTRLREYSERNLAPIGDRGEVISELGADIKGKVSSSMMGAAASLIAEARWNGVEIESLLFPEKAEEFERNERLLETLTEVTSSINSLLLQVPIADLVAKWQEGKRVDQYSLAPLYSFLGNLGRLMQESSRRALYSGDYHQIQRRENRLNTRIAELTTLHNMTWGMVPAGIQLELQAVFPVMARKAIELAAVLDLEILRKTIGSRLVDQVLRAVTEKKASQNERLVANLPEDLRGLVPLLFDEDLKTFLSLLLGSVQKRASLAARRRGLDSTGGARALEDVGQVAPPAAPPPAAPQPPAPQLAAPLSAAPPPAAFPPTVLLPTAPLPQPANSRSTSSMPRFGQPDDRREHRLRALEDLLALLADLGSRSNAERKSFELIQRMLKQQRTVPPTLLRSMHPFLFSMMNNLIPRLNDSNSFGTQLTGHATSLIQYCQVLCQPNPPAEHLREVFPGTMQKVLNLIDGLSAAAAASIEKYRAG